MNRDIHHITDLPITGNEGWQQMQLLLNERMPAKKQWLNKRLLVSYAATTLLITALLFISLQLNTTILFSGMARNTGLAIVQKSTATVLPSAINSFKKSTRVVISANNFANYNKNISPLFLNKKLDLPLHLNALNSSATIAEQLMENTDENSETDKPLNTTINNAVESPAVAAKNTVALPLNKTVKTKRNGYWSLLAGISINVVTGKHQHLQPYPVAVAKYNINSIFYLAASMAAYSPVASNIRGVSQTMYVNDTANNIRLDKETTARPLYYADIPITAGINISKKWSVQGGIQLSVLLNKKTNKTITSYDYRNQSPPVYPMIATSAEQEYTMPVRNVDYRFITGLRYTINKTVIGIDYQYALQPAGKGIHNSRNKVVALSAVFKIK